MSAEGWPVWMWRMRAHGAHGKVGHELDGERGAGLGVEVEGAGGDADAELAALEEHVGEGEQAGGGVARVGEGGPPGARGAGAAKVPDLMDAGERQVAHVGHEDGLGEDDHGQVAGDQLHGGDVKDQLLDGGPGRRASGGRTTMGFRASCDTQKALVCCSGPSTCVCSYLTLMELTSAGSLGCSARPG